MRDQQKKTERDRKARLILDTVRYGCAAVVLAGLTAAMWFLQNTVGIVLLVILCAFVAVAVCNFLVGLLICRSFTKLSKDDSAPYAVISEYGHLELCGGERDTVLKYAQFSAKSYGEMYRPIGNKPTKTEIKSAKDKQKERIAEKKNCANPFSPAACSITLQLPTWLLCRIRPSS